MSYIEFTCTNYYFQVCEFCCTDQLFITKIIFISKLSREYNFFINNIQLLLKITRDSLDKTIQYFFPFDLDHSLRGTDRSLLWKNFNTWATLVKLPCVITPAFVYHEQWSLIKHATLQF